MQSMPAWFILPLLILIVFLLLLLVNKHFPGHFRTYSNTLGANNNNKTVALNATGISLFFINLNLQQKKSALDSL